jgi:hypothetical protein
MVEPTNLCQIGRRGLARRTALIEIDVGLDVVEVETPLAAAPREATHVVTLVDLVAEPVRCFVGVDADLFGQVDHRGDRDGGSWCKVG